MTVTREALVSGVASVHRLISTHQIFFGRDDECCGEATVSRFQSPVRCYVDCVISMEVVPFFGPPLRERRAGSKRNGRSSRSRRQNV